MAHFLWFLILGCAALATPADLADNGSPSFSHPTSVFLLAGQSNMAGRGGVVHDVWDRYVPPECRPSPSVLRLNPAQMWELAREPLHSGIDLNKTVGIGPGMSFAQSLLSRDRNVGVIGLVPCAAGGTKISEWARGGHLFNRLIRRGKTAARGGDKIRALLWYQGESDTVDLEDADKYGDRLRKFFMNVRNDMGLPTLPIIQVALATKQGPYMDIVREAQLKVGLPGVKTVDAKGLEVGYDSVHLTTAAEVELGKMMAEAFFRPSPPPLHLQTISNSSSNNNNTNTNGNHNDSDNRSSAAVLLTISLPHLSFCFSLLITLSLLLQYH
ncbi:unnamed protein product [Cuscuta epithymum]|uniref:Sialate O-acetylesterase domain-containing protein n=1 Tax=Cuscuta epithymum TaxID=186058 RepID=A0AAV0E127_9ASTE|nr:unnamed protein product [Cuscuta epithymum]